MFDNLNHIDERQFGQLLQVLIDIRQALDGINANLTKLTSTKVLIPKAETSFRPGGHCGPRT